MEQLVDVTGVEVVGDHRLRVTFADGAAGDVDFRGRESRGIPAPLADAAFLAQERVDRAPGTIAWPSGVDFAPERLYDEAHRDLVEHARQARASSN